MIKPEIGKLPKALVDRIPLVVYIPPPPDEPAGTPKVPEPAYGNTYPPKPKPSTTAPKKRFAFLKPFKGKKGRKGGEGGVDGKGDQKKAAVDGEGSGEPHTWEEHWEQGEYPFVRLEGNRAACAICLMDFEEPKRVAGLSTPVVGNAENAKDEARGQESVAEGPVQEIPVDRIQEVEREGGLKLEDAGEGSQPLRLLACGHVFHVSLLCPSYYLSCADKYLSQKTCLDPWLVDVSGRCPVCQRPVELPEPDKKKKRGRNRTETV